jgi:arylsulfatase A-like enzyme
MILAFLVSILAALPAWAQDSAKPAATQNALLVGWDGAHRDHVKTLLKDGKLPNLEKLIKEGALVDIDVTSGATDTKAGWTQILTGYKPAVTGVYNNARFRDVPEGYSIFERLRAWFGADRVATVAVIGKKGHCGEIDAPFKRPYDPATDVPQAKPGKKAKPGAKQKAGAKPKMRGRVVEEDGRLFLVFDGSPYYTMHKHCDAWHFGLAQDARVGDKAIEMLDQYAKKPFFFFVHFAEVDHSGHKHGEPSKEYDDAIISGDKQLGRLVEKLKALGVYDKTLIYVTADHGFDVGQKRHRAAPYVFLGTNDKQVMRNGCRADVTPTVLARLGVDLGSIRPPLDGEPLIKPATKAIGTPVTEPPAKPKAKPGKAKPRAKRKAKPAG